METNGLHGAVEGHFHPPRLELPPQGVLTVNMGEATNVNSFRARFDMLRPATAQATRLDVETPSTQQAQVDTSQADGLGETTALTAQRPRRVLLSQTGLARTGEAADVRPGRRRPVRAGRSSPRASSTPWPTAACCEPSARAGARRRPAVQRHLLRRARAPHPDTPTRYTQRFTLRRNAPGSPAGELSWPATRCPA